MDAASPVPSDVSEAVFVGSGRDRHGGRRGVRINIVDYKVTSRESSDLFVVEITMLARGGPARHLHYHQDEWWYVAAGTFHVEIGPEKFVLGPGDSVWGRHGIPHAWACVGGPGDRVVVAVTPAGRLEAFFDDVSRADVIPGLDFDWRAYGMEAVGPPLSID